MDQRTGSERSNAREADSPIGRAEEHLLWIDWLREHRKLVLALAASIITVIVMLGVWWVSTGDYVSTVDAFIDTRTGSISSLVNAAIVDVPGDGQ
jgi:multidrug resistance efflux pump